MVTAAGDVVCNYNGDGSHYILGVHETKPKAVCGDGMMTIEHFDLGNAINTVFSNGNNKRTPPTKPTPVSFDTEHDILAFEGFTSRSSKSQGEAAAVPSRYAPPPSNARTARVPSRR